MVYKYRDNATKLQQLLSQRLNLDRRRLEEGFLQYACLETIQKHNLSQDLPLLPTDRNKLLEIVTKKFSKAFLDKWRGKLVNCCMIISKKEKSLKFIIIHSPRGVRICGLINN